MNTKLLFYNTLVISIIVQVITGVIELAAFFVKIPSIYLIIRQLLIIELVVQFIEGGFYVWLAYNFKNVLNITPKRYIDWVITTPTMLISLMVYLIYLDKKTENKTHELEIFKLWNENFAVFTTVLVLNWLMLLFGYLAEMKIIPVLLGVFLGFIPFLMYYYIIYENFVTKHPNGEWLFWYFFIFWGLYGFVAVLPYYLKNACYNILDLFAKNFFGVLLTYIVLSGNY
uniref:Uncharacterized protein n=1 Tax=viral metagenome TaxID=1070528 RepID=A0A6C0LKC0_9ZZZZ